MPFFLERRKTGTLPITDPSMTRFNISLQAGVDMVLWALERAKGGEIFVPKIPSYRITDLAEAIGPDCDKPVIGIRPGEKLHEELFFSVEAANPTSHQKISVAAESAPDGLDIDEMYKEVERLTVTEDRAGLEEFLRRVAGMGAASA